MFEILDEKKSQSVYISIEKEDTGYYWLEIGVKPSVKRFPNLATEWESYTIKRNTPSVIDFYMEGDKEVLTYALNFDDSKEVAQLQKDAAKGHFKFIYNFLNACKIISHEILEKIEQHFNEEIESLIQRNNSASTFFTNNEERHYHNHTPVATNNHPPKYT